MKRRVVVLGLDGLSLGLARRLGADGVMPNLHRALQQCGTLSMDTVHPALSPVCWTTFFTGVNPGRHRIYGFYECQVDAYQLWTQNLKDVKAPALWEHLQAEGRRTVAINLPGTYPAQPLNGVMISGFLTLDWEQSFYPKKLDPVLKQAGYRIDVDCGKPGADPAAFFEDCSTAIRARAHVLATFLQHEPFDLFLGVFTETDRIQHYFFDALEDPHHPHRARVLELFSEVDEALGRCLEAVRDEDELLFVADHGFERIQLEVYLNHWLESRGYLRLGLRGPECDLPNVVPSGTRAFCLDPGRIYLNLRGRQPDGCVDPGERARLVEQIAAELTQMEIRVPWARAPVRPISAAFPREELYSGPYTHLAPDLVAVASSGFDLKGGFGTPGVTRLRKFTGMHTYGGALCARRGAELPPGANIAGLAPLILDLLELPPLVSA